jgi:hypothetical protein
MKSFSRPRKTAVVLLGLCLAASVVAWAQGRQAEPPEYKELVAAFSIKDAGARIKELERIKAAFPESRFKDAIAGGILTARIELAETLDEVLALQSGGLADPNADGMARLRNAAAGADQILSHPKLRTFDQAAVLAAVTKYKETALAAAADPATFEKVPQEQRAYVKSRFVVGLDLHMAMAQLNAGQTAKASETLKAYRSAGGPSDGSYNHKLGQVLEKEGKTAEAFEAFLSAAVEDFGDSKDRAKALYVKSHGGEGGFEAALEARAKALPFHPGAFKAPAGWTGKAVLAELFTGSECPPCVGADLGFDGLIESVPSRYLVVLTYHLPIPRPDPMMNPATKARQDFYGVNSTPTVFIDGATKMVGGGNRGMAESKFAEYKAAVEPLLSAAPEVSLKVRASLAGETVKAAYEFDKAVPGAEYSLVLVQGEELYKGSNGLVSHKMVVRDLVAVDPAAPKAAVFDLAASEKAADAYLTEFEKTYTRVPNFTWAVRRNAIARQGLKVVLFVQDKASKKVLNAVVADVEK